MSLCGNWQEDHGCDFPGCGNEYDKHSGVRVAIITKEDGIQAFCEEHCRKLLRSGVKLRTHDDVLEEIEDKRLGIDRKRNERERIAREKAFIKKLREI